MSNQLIKNTWIISRNVRKIQTLKWINQKNFNTLRNEHHVNQYKWHGKSAEYRCGVVQPRRYSVKVEQEEHVVNSPYPDIIIPKENVAEYVWKDINRWQNHTATICGVTGRSYTYAKLRDRSAAFGSRLRTVLKLQPGDTVAVAMLSLPEYPITVLGAAEAGLVVTTINPIYTADEIEKQLIDSAAKAVVASSDVCSTVLEAVSKLPRAIPVVLVSTETGDSRPDGVISFSEFTDPQGVDFAVLSNHGRTIDDVVFLPYSSGTTGLPNGVELSHKNATTTCEMALFSKHKVAETSDSFQEVVPTVLPLFHVYGLVVLMTSKLSLGNKLVTIPKFTPMVFLDILERHKATLLFVVPPIVLFLSSYQGVDGRHLDSVKAVLTGAAPLGESDVNRFKLKAPQVEFGQGYGLTEAPVVLTADMTNKNYASVGVPNASTQCKIVSLESGKNLKPGPVGELWVRGPQVMKGYRNNPGATKETLDDNGWLRTGDLAYYDKDGNFYITERLKELIKVKGFQVPPAELEAVIRTHPDLDDAAVVGVPHPTSGEVPRAFVVRKPGSTVTEKDIQDFVAKKVAVYKQLTGGVTMVDNIPKNAAGKIMRRVLKTQYCS